MLSAVAPTTSSMESDTHPVRISLDYADFAASSLQMVEGAGNKSVENVLGAFAVLSWSWASERRERQKMGIRRKHWSQKEQRGAM